MEILRKLTIIPRLVETEISSWIVLVLTVLTTFDVILRYGLKHSLPGAFELSCILLVIVVFFSFGEVQTNKENIRVDFVINRLSPKVRRYLEVIIHFVALLFFLFLFLQSIEFFKSSFAVKEYEGMIRVPVYPSKAAMVMGFGVMVIELIKDIVGLLGKKKEIISDVNRERS